MADAAPILRMVGLTKHFGRLVAVNDVSLDIQEGEFFTIVGPSGSGKTTLLRMLGGLEKPSAGEYVNAAALTNGIESFWALLKRGYHCTFHHVNEKHLGRYVREFAGRQNIRDLGTIAQMSVLARGMDGRRLRYRDLVSNHA